VNPIAFKLGPFPVHWYGIMVAIGFLAGLWTAGRRGLREGVAAEKIMDLGPWLILGAIVGARILYVVSYWREQFAAKPISEIFMVQHGGLVYYGGLIGSSLAYICYSLWKKIPLWKGADILAPSIALGHALGRIGCLLNGCCYGRPCSLPWAITYPHREGGPPGVPLHPTQVYESLLNFILYAALAALYRRKKFDGQVFAAYLVGYAFIRSFVELFRGDYPQYYFGKWVTPAHLVSIVILIIGLILLRALPRIWSRKSNAGGDDVKQF
jgi:phosphatidylglycerol:prolipoprotein diacylglycerol transferase